MFQVYIRFILVCCLWLIALPGANAAVKESVFIEGQDYVRLPADIRNNPNVTQLMASDPNKIQVIFFFSYGCHACEHFHQPFEKWSAKHKTANSKVVVYRYPVSFNPQWQILAKAYYTMELLDPTGKLNDAIFEAIHKRGAKLWQEPVMTSFFVQHGYKAKQFENAYTSFGVSKNMKRADDIAKAYKIAETPDIIINGPYASYKVDVARVEGDLEKFFKIVDFIVAKEAKLLGN